MTARTEGTETDQRVWQPEGLESIEIVASWARVRRLVEPVDDERACCGRDPHAALRARSRTNVGVIATETDRPADRHSRQLPCGTAGTVLRMVVQGVGGFA